ncbi:MAG: sigma-70 family RNA polymerase sigma factor [Cyclobacteriaceae bacterium]|nr:sigma-70 family RNA polymerase sigma factor [Cyclobacteriaceae bacterium]MDW8330940.1 sigma-70 family RNA polymerase sigma factor [Cyclobacteriaceae bacterium]
MRHVRTDEELIATYRQTGSMEVVGTLFTRYSALVLGVCLKYLKNREEARDAAMHLFEKLPDLLMRHEIVFFKGWLYTTVRNHCLMILRGQKNKAIHDMNDFIVENAAIMHPDDGFPEENLAALEDCITKLNEGQQRCVRLFYLEQKCYAEVAELTGFTLKAVKSHIQNGKRNLKICMEQHARLQQGY